MVAIVLPAVYIRGPMVIPLLMAFRKEILSMVLLLAIKGNKNNLGAFLGGISYPLYLNHWIGVFVANALLKPFSLNNSLYRLYLELMINLVIAGILFMLIEKPILARRNALYTLSRGKIACYSAYVLVFTGITYGLTRAI